MATWTEGGLPVLRFQYTVLWKEAGGPVLTLEAFIFQTQLFIYLPFSNSQFNSSVYLKFQQEAGKLIWRRVLPAFMPPVFSPIVPCGKEEKNIFKKTSTKVIPSLYGRFNLSKICPTFLADQSDSASRVHRFIWSTLSPNLEVITLVMLSYKYLFSYTCRCS